MVKLKDISKEIKKQEILKNISYTFEDGHIYGLYGANGSGKTMLLRIISGLVFPTNGTVCIDEKVLHKDISFPPSVGIIIENMELLPELTAYENLNKISKIKKIAGEQEIRYSLERVGLDTNKPVKKFSLGMKQRLNIAQAIFESPKLILLDEPTNALDDDAINRVYNILKEEKARGACIIMATHNKSDLTEICDTIIKVNEGHIEVNNE